MITNRSDKREIHDLQLLLLTAGFLAPHADSEWGWWGPETQDAVQRAYAHLGWSHSDNGMSVTAPALAAIARVSHQHVQNAVALKVENGKKVRATGIGAPMRGGGSLMGGGGSLMGGGGSLMGGGGSLMGGGGTAVEDPEGDEDDATEV